MTDDDSTDELAKAIFEAARRRRPSDAARAATRAALLGVDDSSLLAPGNRNVTHRRLAWAGFLAAAALFVAALVLRDRVTTVPPISAEDLLPGRTTETKPVATSSSAESLAPPNRANEQPSFLPRKVVRPQAEKPDEKPPEPPPAPSLSDEVGALDRVRTALSASDGARALRLLDEYDGVLHGTRLIAEATLLRVEALSRSGQRGSAARLARRFIEANPGSPLVEGARAFIGSAATDGTATSPDSGF
jgi:hypothetical protein